jgi:hypothetical protein
MDRRCVCCSCCCCCGGQLIAGAGAVLLQREILEAANIQVAKVKQCRCTTAVTAVCEHASAFHGCRCIPSVPGNAFIQQQAMAESSQLCSRLCFSNQYDLNQAVPKHWHRTPQPHAPCARHILCPVLLTVRLCCCAGGSSSWCASAARRWWGGHTPLP